MELHRGVTNAAFFRSHLFHSLTLSPLFPSPHTLFHCVFPIPFPLGYHAYETFNLPDLRVSSFRMIAPSSEADSQESVNISWIYDCHDIGRCVSLIGFRRLHLVLFTIRFVQVNCNSPSTHSDIRSIADKHLAESHIVRCGN